MTNFRRAVSTLDRPQDLDALAAMVKRMFTDDNVIRLVLDKEKAFILYEHRVPIEEAAAFSALVYQTVRNRDMEEYVGQDDPAPFKQVEQMFQLVAQEGFEVCFLLAGSREKFGAWLGLRFPRQKAKLFGVDLLFDGGVPPDVFIVCGAPSREVYPTDISFSVKVTLP